MRRWRLSLVMMKGMFIPGIILILLGTLHCKRNMIERVGDQYHMVKSPYMFRIKGWFDQYKEKLKKKLGIVTHSLYHKLLDENARKRIIENEVRVLNEKKELLGEKPVTGNEIRAFINIQEKLDKNVEALAKAEAKILSLEKEIEDITKYKECCLNQMQEKAKAMCYAYIQGVQHTAKAPSYYVVSKDHDEELFEYLNDAAA